MTFRYIRSLQLLLLSLFISVASVAAWNGKLGPVAPRATPVPPPQAGAVVDRNGTVIPSYNTTYYFDQLIDHNNPSLGTFRQRYWHTWEFYEPGGPIVLFIPGESNADGSEIYLTNQTINGIIAQQNHGTTVILEHRFYSYSNPFNNLSIAALQYHTIQQTIDDFSYFANNVKLPMPGGDHVSPADAPWVLTGGSYGGALVSFTKVNQPDVFWAVWASSATVESIVDYWGYFDIIRTYMAPNCSADLQAVAAYFDEAVQSNNETAINIVKSAFNMTDVKHLDDIAYALARPVTEWEGLQPDTDPSTSVFFQLCDALEVDNGVSAPAAGWGLEMHSKHTAPGGKSPITCPLAAMLPWSGAPEGTPSLVSRVFSPAYSERACTYYFPEDPPVNVTNAAYDGWFAKADRIFFANGLRDVWRDATKSASGTNFASTGQQPISMHDSFHCSDLLTVFGELDESILDVQVEGVAYISAWLAEWTPPSQS